MFEERGTEREEFEKCINNLGQYWLLEKSRDKHLISKKRITLCSDLFV